MDFISPEVKTIVLLIKDLQVKTCKSPKIDASFNGGGSITLHLRALGSRFQPEAVLGDAGDSPHIKSLSPLCPAFPLFLPLRAADVEFTA